MATTTRPTASSAYLLTPAALLLATTAWSQGLPKIEHTFANGSIVRFYGQINKGVLSYDDGIETESYALIDNDNSGTRVGLTYTQSFGDWVFENTNEFSYAPFSTSNTNLLHQSPDHEDWEFSNANIRKLDFTFANDRAGKFWIGQGSMATDGILEIDLSGTDIIAYSGVADSAGAQIIRFSDPALADSLTGPEIGSVFANLDGDRRVRVRYDAPSYAHVTAAAAFGRNLLGDDPDAHDQNIFDASLVYDNEFDAFELQAGLGYYWQDSDTQNLGGSISALHVPTGLNLTLATGKQNGEGDQDPSFWYSKLGLLRSFFDFGNTAMSVDYYSGSDFGLDDTAGITSSSSKSWGLALVQNIDRANTELWLTYRSYDFSENVAGFDDSKAIFGGARFRF